MIHFNQVIPDETLKMKVMVSPQRIIGLEDDLHITAMVIGPPFAGGRLTVQLMKDMKMKC